MWFGAMRDQVTCAPAPSPAGRSRWRIAISHSWTSECSPPMVCCRWWRRVRASSAVARMDCSSRHEVVTMQRPSSRFVSMDRPRQPSDWPIVGSTSSVTYLMPSSSLSGVLRMLVDRAYMPLLGSGVLGHLGDAQVRDDEVELGDLDEVHA